MIITLEDLATAIAARVDIDMESAIKDANFVMDLFLFDEAGRSLTDARNRNG